MMRAVDTNLLARLVLRDDPKQLASVEALLATGETFFIPLTVLLELAWLLHAVGIAKKALPTVLDHLTTSPSFAVDDPAAVAHAIALFRAGLDIADAFHVAACIDAAAVLTFDAAFAKKAKKAKSATAIELLR